MTSDQWGNVVVYTLTLEQTGGSGIVVPGRGFLVNRIDLGMSLGEAIAAPRASQQNTTITEAEPAFLNHYERALKARGQQFATNPEIGAATGLEFLGTGRVIAVAEPARRGGGSALVVRPRN